MILHPSYLAPPSLVGHSQSGFPGAGPFGPGDITPEATTDTMDRRASGIAENLRSQGMMQIPTACLSRGSAGLRGKTLVINLPGSLRGPCARG